MEKDCCLRMSDTAEKAADNIKDTLQRSAKEHMAGLQSGVAVWDRSLYDGGVARRFHIHA